MEKLNLDQATVSVPCGQCGQKLTQTIGWLKAQRQFTCTCGAINNVDLTKFDQGVASAQKSLDALGDTLRNFGKR